MLTVERDRLDEDERIAADKERQELERKTQEGIKQREEMDKKDELDQKFAMTLVTKISSVRESCWKCNANLIKVDIPNVVNFDLYCNSCNHLTTSRAILLKAAQCGGDQQVAILKSIPIYLEMVID